MCGMASLLALGAAVAAAPAGAAFPGGNGRIVFQSNRDGHPEIYSMSADGSGEFRLTNDDAGNRTPSYSPDGRKIVFWSNRDGNAEIYTMSRRQPSDADHQQHRR
jgi:Tol biopolymer transport system component